MLNPPIVETTSGMLQGIRDCPSGVCRFLGIPYAQPPVGELRFRPTQPVKPWSGIRKAERFGAASAQVFDPQEAPYQEFVDDCDAPAQHYVGEEDSLTLNIWTPGVEKSGRPVLVWIHGGANWLESSRLSIYHGDRFVERGDVVFVSMNYRLGIFGFLDLSVIGGAEYAGSHSNGLRDQLTALDWVKANIAAFGGNPDNITLMGESAGSVNISWLLSTGRLHGLVRRLVMMSGVASGNGIGHDHVKSVYTSDAGQERAREFLSEINLRSFEQVKTLRAEEILLRQADLAHRTDILFYMDKTFHVRADGAFISADPFESARAGVGTSIDLMIGYTDYEMGLWLLWNKDLDRHTPDWAAAQVPAFPKALVHKLAALYVSALPDETAGAQGMYLLGDAAFAIPAHLFADEYCLHNPNVWMYQFDWEANPRVRALHAADQCFLFDKTREPMGETLVGAAQSAVDTANRQRLSWAFQDAVLAFARCGDPNKAVNRSLPRWPRYESHRRSVMRLNNESRVDLDPRAERRRWWTEQVYAPIYGYPSRLHPPT